MFSGTIPALVYYGVQLVNPRFMIVTAFLITAMMSMTGSSWAAAGTIGVALMGVATITALLAATAGAVVSGAYFGDKLSPLSDQTNICAIAANANLYDHIRNMAITAGPSIVVALVVYLITGLATDAGHDASTVQPILAEIQSAYQINPGVFLPALIVIVGTFRRKPAALVMALSSVVAIIIGMSLHGFSVQHAVISAINGFDVSMTGLTQTPSESLTSLLSRGGINSMSSTLILIIAAFLFAACHGCLRGTGQVTKRHPVKGGLGDWPDRGKFGLGRNHGCPDQPRRRHRIDSGRVVPKSAPGAKSCA